MKGLDKIDIKKNRGYIYILISIIILSLWLFFGEHGFIYLKNSRNYLNEYSVRVDRLLQEKEELEKEINRLKTDKDYLKQVIREETGMIKKNEIIYVFDKEDHVAKDDASK